ncbi:MAG TPA: multidrug efflux RND transporter permease subunit [Hyphomicrobiales bacterium]|nr:multidrug efflux RND transporter permease subunit [Hyphomicrobiales bacterium]
MNFRFFIDRPVLSSVIAIVIVLAGVLSLRVLPVAQYPDIVPPQVVVTATYPGADADTIATTVAAPLEQQINGVDDMLYMQSSSSGGTMRLTITFEIGTDPDQATINVSNRVARAEPSLPQDVTRLGVTVVKRSTSILALVTMQSSDKRYDPTYISNYALLNVIDDLKRVPGVGDASLFGASNYAMRVWLRPDKLAEYNLTPSDVAAAIREQNAQFAAGRFGDDPNNEPLAFTYSVTTGGRLPSAADFGNIILRSDANGAALHLRDVATIELGAQNYSFAATRNGEPTVPIGIYLQPGANALNTIHAVEAKMDELAQRFPSGITYAVPFDTTLFIQASIDEVLQTFAEALCLVVLVVFIFLQSVRATLIPLIAVPVAIVGTFAGLYALGFSINLLTLFALVLATGIVVDDAIVVLENTERLMATEHLSPRAAAVKSMEQVAAPVVAIVLVLCAVFVPVAFLGGLAGQLYRQFAVTIAIAVVISGFVALTLTPALCALILKPGGHREPALPFRLFNRFFARLTAGYSAGVRLALRHAAVAVALVAIMIGATVWLGEKVPSSLVPDEDQGIVFGVVILPPAASLDRTKAAVAQVTKNVLHHPAVKDVLSFAGFDLLAGAQKSSAGAVFVQLKDWSQRSNPAWDTRVLPGPLMGMNAGIKDALFLAFNPPPIFGLSTTGGFEAYVQDRTGGTTAALVAATNQLLAAAAKRPELSGVRTTFDAGVPQYKVTVDRDKAKALGVPVSSVFDTMTSTFGSLYVNDFTMFGRNYQVLLQSVANFRESPDDLKQVFVRSNNGRMIPLNALVEVKRIVGPDQIDRFNGFTAAHIMGNPAPGYSSGQALAVMQQVAEQSLPAGYTIAWTGSSYQELSTSGTGTQAFIFGIVMAFLILAALYERWSLPVAVLLAVPFALFGALAAVFLRGINNDIYFQIGLVTLIGLSAKNAILIVQFAAHRREEGATAPDAAREAAQLRFRPILMTSLAFIFGVLPLAVSTGAGAAARHSIGTGVIGGMVGATFLAMFFVPLFYRLIAWRTPKPRHGTQEAAQHGAPAE